MKLFNHTCEMCGKEFQSKSWRSRFCKDQHYARCCICGKEFPVPLNNVSYYFDNRDRVTCGDKKCVATLSLQKCSAEERKKKMKESMLAKYGVENPGQLKSVIEKRTQTNILRYGSSAPIANPEIQVRMKQRNLEKYGVEFITQSEEFKEKSRQTCLERYGVEHATQSEEFKAQAAQSMLERYGVEHALQSVEIQERRRQSNLQKYGVAHPMQTPEGVERMKQGIAAKHDGNSSWNNPEKIKETCLERYGVEHYFQSEDYRNKVRKTSLAKYGVDHHLKSSEIIEKRRQTCLERYGDGNVLASKFGIQKARETMLRKYGVVNPSQYKPFKDKATRNARKSKLELRILDLFINYEIDFVTHYFISSEDEHISHEFDFYIPKYKLLIDADGLYYHAYLNDPNGKASLDYYDDIRIKLVPPDHLFYLIVEGTEDQQVKQIVKILEDIDNGIFNYDSFLFDWCRSIDFPYPEYTEKRLLGDWSRLCQYENLKYKPQCRIGESIIKQFHRSIFSCKRNNSVSPIEAWYDDSKLKDVIKNRLIYINDVDPSKILRGFNISKICPVVSMFNPILAKYLVQKYLSEFSTIFDPFSGFSGRLLGTVAAGKKYVGQDLNPAVISESQHIMEFLNLSDKTSIEIKDIFNSDGEYECLLTCPPYGKKEIYNSETTFLSCDEWIDECLKRFKCKRYVFVVDETSKYSQYVVETLDSTSHFAKVKEQVIVIDKE